MYKLIIEDDEGKTTVVPLIRNEITIGREEGNTIRLTERNVSRHHAKLVQNNSQLAVEDMGSYNGVWINGDRIQGRSNVRPGDLIEIGDYHLAIKDESQETGKGARSPLPAQLPPGEQESIPGEAPTAATWSPTTEKEDAPARMVVLNTNFAGTEFTLDGSEMMLGRTEDNEICIDHRSVSRHHAKVISQGGGYKIIDLQSANGVRVNGEDYAMCDLRRGDIIELGHVRIRFVEPGERFTFQGDSATPLATSSAGSGSGPRSILWGALAAVVLVLAAGGVYLLRSAKKTAPLDGGSARLAMQPPRSVRSVVPRPPPESNPAEESPKSLLSRAQKAFERQEFSVAGVILKSLLTLHPEMKEAQRLKEKLKEEQHNQSLLQKAQQARSLGKYQEAYQILAEIPAESFFVKEATRTQKELLPRVVLELTEKARQQEKEGNLQAAMELYQKISLYNPADETAREARKRLYQKIQKKKNILARVRRRPSRRRVRSRRPPSRKRRRRPRKRRRNRKLAHKLTQQGHVLMSENAYKSARGAYRRAIRSDPSYAPPYRALGITLAILGHCRTPNKPTYNKKRCDQAAYYYERYLKLAPNAKDAPRIRNMLQDFKKTKK